METEAEGIATVGGNLSSTIPGCTRTETYAYGFVVELYKYVHVQAEGLELRKAYAYECIRVRLATKVYFSGWFLTSVH